MFYIGVIQSVTIMTVRSFVARGFLCHGFVIEAQPRLRFSLLSCYCTSLYFMLYDLKLPFFGRDANCVKCSKYGASTLGVM